MEPEWGRETSGKLVLESLEPEPFWHHHWWLRYLIGIQLNLGSMDAEGHDWQPAFFDPQLCVRGSERALCLKGDTAAAQQPQGHKTRAEAGQLRPRNGSKSAYNSSGFTWCNQSLILVLSIVCWLHFDVMNVSYFSCFDNKSGAWLQRKPGLEHPVASQKQMCYQYRHLFLMIDLRHNSPSKA